MGLEEKIQKVFTAVQVLDHRIQQGYTKQAQELSDTMLYTVTFGLNTIGLFVGAVPLVATLGHEVSNPYLTAAPFGLFGFDGYYNGLALVYTLAGYSHIIQQQPTSEGVLDVNNTIRSIISKCRSVNNVIRLPTVFVSLGLMGKRLYEVAASLFGDASPDSFSDPFVYFSASLGFLATASSMYLKERTNTTKQ